MKIEIPQHTIGWLNFILDKSHQFTVSYLSNFKEEIDYLLTLPIGDMAVKRICLDGEGSYLYLTAWREFEELYLIWEEWTEEDKQRINVIKSKDFETFKESFKKAFDAVSDDYYERFILR